MIKLKPVGIVSIGLKKTDPILIFNKGISCIQIFDEYRESMKNMDLHSHFWILSWMHEADREVKSTSPKFFEVANQQFGVFGLRCSSRPNPVGLSLVKLIRIEESTLSWEGLDLIEGTPIIDIKPYFEPDSIFSPKAPYLRPRDDGMRIRKIYNDAINHHQEDCLDLRIALKMAILAEAEFLTLTDPLLTVSVTGPRCLVDSIQGMTRARFANPARLTFYENNKQMESTWQLQRNILTIRLKVPFQKLTQSLVSEMSPIELFETTILESNKE